MARSSLLLGSALTSLVLAAASPAASQQAIDLDQLTATQAAADLCAGKITSKALTTAALARAKAKGELNAFITLDEAGAMKAAEAFDAGRRKGSCKPLGGVPVVIKDNIEVAGLPASAGTPALKGFVPKKDAPVAAKLRAAGAIIIGKTNMHELAFGISGYNAAFKTGAESGVRNAYDATKIAGGSSAGTGTAVGARIVTAGLGTDTGGSVRVPCALNGCAALRPTVGRYPQAGIAPISHTRDTAGPMTRSVADCALLDRVVTGSALPTALASLAGVRLGVPRAHFWEPLDHEVARLMEGTLAALKDAGAVLVEADIADVGRLDGEAGFPIALYETVVDLNAYLASHGSTMKYAELVAQCASPDMSGLLQSLAGDGAVPEAAYRHALDVLRPQLQAAYRDHFKRHDLAAVVFPTTPLAAVPIGEDETVSLNGERVPTFPTFIRNSSPGSVAGIPGISLPAARTQSGLPLGIELDGPEGSDARLLAIARAVEAILPKMPAPKG